MKWLKKHAVTIILILVVLLGICMIAYPAFSDWWNSMHQSRAVASYTEAVANLDTSAYDKMIHDAEVYNEKLAEKGVELHLTDEETAEYEALLDVNQTGIMGYIEIPKLNLLLPVYHGVDDPVLQIAIGHLAGTSLPVGGETSHCVLSGHRGLPSARLFTDIDKLEIGDVWTVTVLNRIYYYEADEISVVEPDDLSKIQMVEGMDYCTLETCTPYGINTHRLLVRGHRYYPVDEPEELEEPVIIEEDHDNILLLIILILFIAVIILTIQLARSSKKRKKR